MINTEFKTGDRARVVLGSSKDQKRGDAVKIIDIYTYNQKVRVNAITTKTKHKFWCYYEDLMQSTK